jgi:hypothetical protein
MARVKEIKGNHNSILSTSIIDIICEIDPSKTNKFLPVFVKIIEEDIERRIKGVKYEKDYFIGETLDVFENKKTTKEIEKLTNEELFFNFCKIRILDVLTSREEIKTMMEFMDNYERKLINFDLGQIKNMEDVERLLSLSRIKDIEKEGSNNVKIEYRDDEWLILRPLTFLSSLKYGAGTKWCTASRNNPDHFYRYAKSGILAYCINLKTGNKYGYFKSLENEIDNDIDYITPTNEISFWNAKDNRIDSMTCDFPPNVLNVIKNLENITNSNINPENWKKEFDLSYQMYENRCQVEPVSDELNEMLLELENEVVTEPAIPRIQRVIRNTEN